MHRRWVWLGSGRLDGRAGLAAADVDRSTELDVLDRAFLSATLVGPAGRRLVSGAVLAVDRAQPGEPARTG